MVVGEYGVMNGGEHSFLAVCDALRRRGWSFTAAVPCETEFASAFFDRGIPNFGHSAYDDSGVRLSQQAIRDQVAAIIDIAKPALLHANSLSMSRICGPVAAEIGLPSIGYLRDILKLSKKAVADINQLDKIVAVSNATAQWHIDQGFNRERVTTIYNGVDSLTFRPLEIETDRSEQAMLRAEIGLEVDDRAILYVGQIGMRKGIDSLANVFMEVAKTLPNVHLIIVGERNSTKAEAVEYERQIRLAIERSGFARRFHWLGRRSDVPKLMRLANVLLHPAKQEPLGRVLLEASSAGLPIVTTKVGGSAEILPSDAPLFEPSDVAGMAEFTCKLLSNDRLRLRTGASQRNLARSRFSIEQCADRLERIYVGLLG